MVFSSNFIFWWGSYNVFKNWGVEYTSLSNTAINFWTGGISTTVFWIFAYPVNVIKQVIMTDSPTPSQKKFPHYMDAAKYIYRERSLNGFTSGFVLSILCSFPANASALAVFEAVLYTLH